MKRLLLCLIVLSLLLPAALADDEHAVVTGGKLRLRERADRESAVLGAYVTGTVVTVRGRLGDWSLVLLPDGQTGYMMSSYLEPAGDLTVTGYGKVTNHGRFVNVRSAPSLKSAVIAKAQDGETIALIAERDGWYRVRYQGVVGYMESDLLTETTAEAAASAQAQSPFTFDLFDDAERVLEWGQTEAAVQYGERFSYSVQYPAGAGSALDALLKLWTVSLIAEFSADFDVNHAENTVNGGEEEDEPLIASAELTVQYDTYLIGGRCQSVLEYGWYSNSEMAHSMDLLLAAVYDPQTDTLYQGKALFTDADAVKALLRAELAKNDNGVIADLLPAALDDAWLENAYLTHEGVAFALQRGICLPMYFGTQSVTVPYADIARYLTLAMDEAPTAPTPSAPRESAPAPARDIDPNKPMVALTFDDGPSDNTARILATLAENNARATFCMVGNRMENYAQTVADVVAGGHEIATHTWNHKKLTALSAADVRANLERSLKKTREMTGKTVTMLRPPYGSTNSTVRAVCRDLGLVIVNWSIDTEDWRTRNAQTTYQNVMSQVQNGSIILCHDLYAETADAVALFVPALVEKGYQILSVEELYAFHVGGVDAGKVYTHLDPKNIIKETTP